MQICEQDLSFFEHFALDGLRLLDLDDKFGAIPDVLWAGCDVSSGPLILSIDSTNAISSAGFDENSVSAED